ncbi:MAG: thymidylate synthase [Lachnospiraceae bacterium]|nr:thymidylate synthase [Lachnospiraceae bacterium]
MKFDETYVKVLQHIMENGTRKQNRTGTDTLSVFNTQICAEEDAEGYNNIPLSNLRKVYFKGALIEVFWILGLHMKDERYSNLPQTNTQYLLDHGVKYWQPWANKDNNLGPVYGAQLVNWHDYKLVFPEDYDYGVHGVEYKSVYVNQIQNIIDTLRTNPDDRRLVATMWNPAKLSKMALPPCHHTMEFYSQPTPDGKRILHTRWMQRSCDMPIGIPYDMLLYTLLNKIVALCAGHIPGHVYGLLGDSHIYVNQIDGVKEMLNRAETEEFKACPQPKIYIEDRIFDIITEKGWCDLSDFNIDGSDFKLVEYKPLAKIDIPVSV